MTLRDLGSCAGIRAHMGSERPSPRLVRWVAIGMIGGCTALAAQGDLDTTFGANGVRQMSIGSKGVDTVGGLVLQPDGKIVVEVSADGYVALVRLDQGGAPTRPSRGARLRDTPIPARCPMISAWGGWWWSMEQYGDAGTDRNAAGTFFFLRTYDDRGTIGDRFDTSDVATSFSPPAWRTTAPVGALLRDIREQQILRSSDRRGRCCLREGQRPHHQLCPERDPVPLAPSRSRSNRASGAATSRCPGSRLSWRIRTASC